MPVSINDYYKDGKFNIAELIQLKRQSPDDYKLLVQEVQTNRNLSLIFKANLIEYKQNSQKIRAQAVEGRDQALHERAQALHERAQALHERDQASHERAQALHERAQALQERDQLLQEADEIQIHGAAEAQKYRAIAAAYERERQIVVARNNELARSISRREASIADSNIQLRQLGQDYDASYKKLTDSISDALKFK